ncbi:MAG: response regulator [Burkholderiaceae bacterium]
MSPEPVPVYRVALEGFSAFERTALTSFFRLAGARSPAYRQVEPGTPFDLLIADADQPESLAGVGALGRAADTVFVGASAPAGAGAWLARPIDPVHIVRELDVLVERRGTLRPDIAMAHDRVDLEGAPAPPPVGRAAPLPGGGRDVLVVDDSAIARKFLAQRLHSLGYRVQLALSGEQALGQVARQPFAIVVIDIDLGPGSHLDGLQLCRQIRQRSAAGDGWTPALVLFTAADSAADRVRGSLAGCDAYLTKPLGEHELQRVLREVDPLFDWEGAAPQAGT